MSYDQIPLWDEDEEGEEPSDPIRVPKRLRSLKQAREFLQNALDDGVVCPCCDKFAKRYRRKLNSGVAAWLLVLVRLHRDTGDWVHTRDVIRDGIFRLSSAHGSGQAQSLLPHWGLVKGGSKGTGLWIPTDKGLEFALNKITVQRRVVTYNNICEGFDGDQISIHDALGDKFDYDELMAARPV